MITKTTNKKEYYLLTVEGPVRPQNLEDHADAIEEAVAKEKSIIVDLKDCEFIVSNALSFWIHAKNETKKIGKKFILVNHSSQVNNLLRSTGLYEAFTIAKNFTDAEEMI